MRNSKAVFRSLHIVWAIIGLYVSFMLTLTTGHPPGIVFLPLSLVIWGLGHAFIWFSHKLLIQGLLKYKKTNNDEKKLPLTLIIILFIFGSLFFIGLIKIIITLMDQHSKQSELLIVLAIWIPTSICFMGILLRKPWSRFLSSSMFITASVIFIYVRRQLG